MLLALVAVVVVAAAAAPPVTTFPARFSNHERVVAVGTITGHGISRRVVQRTANDDTLVFDDAQRLHIDDPSAPGGMLTATWRCPSRRVVVFTWTPDVVAVLRDRLAAEVPFPVKVTVGSARLNFGRAGAKYTGTQVIRCSGRYQGFLVSIVETVTYTGTFVPAAATTPAVAGSLPSALGDAVARIAQRLNWKAAQVAK
jgi:hypothetical protein